MKKSNYTITNWSDYNKALKNRGRINFWISDDAISNWICGTDTRNYYSDASIELCLTLMSVYHLNLRSVQGFIESVFELSGINLEVPDFSTICRRRKTIKCVLGSFKTSGEVHVAIDSTGIKIYGEGEWKVRMHGISKRRTWRKLHIGVNESNGEILSAKVTTASIADGDMLVEIISDIDVDIKQVSADKGYDKRKCYEVLSGKGIKATIDIMENAVFWADNGIGHQRNENLYYIKLYDKETWKLCDNYHRRSISENVFFRFKTIFGDNVTSRLLESQTNDIIIRCKILNKMFQDCKPISVKIN